MHTALPVGTYEFVTVSRQHIVWFRRDLIMCEVYRASSDMSKPCCRYQRDPLQQNQNVSSLREVSVAVRQEYNTSTQHGITTCCIHDAITCTPLAMLSKNRSRVVVISLLLSPPQDLHNAIVGEPLDCAPNLSKDCRAIETIIKARIECHCIWWFKHQARPTTLQEAVAERWRIHAGLVLGMVSCYMPTTQHLASALWSLTVSDVLQRPHFSALDPQ
ncbi:hypothetical protein Pelo_18125 [Pelomyxa schiedti]|nr:hypothetical protein Pelo_18125 [Pelomyxa schiedti]